MAYRTTLSGQTFVFDDVKTVLARANEEKSGDILAGVAGPAGIEPGGRQRGPSRHAA